MESCRAFFGLFSEISWLWYVVSVFIAFGVGALWYTVLFGKQWIKAVNYVCLCGAHLGQEEKCTCPPRFPHEMVFQFISTAIVGLMYFIITPFSIWMAIFVCIAFSAWTKSMYKFEIASWKRFTTLVGINVGYFVVVSIIFIALSHL